MPSWIQTCCSACTLARAVSPVAPFRLGRPIDPHRRRGADKGQDHGLVRLLLFRRLLVRAAALRTSAAAAGGTSVAAISGCRFTFTPACGMRTFQRLTAACGAWNDTLFWPGDRRDRPGVFQHQFDLLRLLALVLDQQAMILIGPAQQPGRLVLDRGADQGRIGQPQAALHASLRSAGRSSYGP